MLLHFTEDNFENEVIKSDVPVLVDFFAVWCGPCKMIGPTIEELAAEFDGKAKVGKVDIDQASALAMKYEVMSVPTIMIFKNGKIVDKVVGAIPKSAIAQKINSVL